MATLIKSFDYLILPPIVGELRTLEYPQDDSGLLAGLPTVGPAPDPILIMHVPSGATAGLYLDEPSTLHHVYVVRVEENATTVSIAPAAIMIDLITLDSSGSELDRIESLQLVKIPDDLDAQYITYVSDVFTPIVLLNGPIGPDDYPLIHIILAADGGTAYALPAGQ